MRQRLPISELSTTQTGAYTMKDSTLLAITMIIAAMFCVPVMVIGAAAMSIPVFIAGVLLAVIAMLSMAGMFITTE